MPKAKLTVAPELNAAAPAVEITDINEASTEAIVQAVPGVTEDPTLSNGKTYKPHKIDWVSFQALSGPVIEGLNGLGAVMSGQLIQLTIASGGATTDEQADSWERSKQGILNYALKLPEVLTQLVSASYDFDAGDLAEDTHWVKFAYDDVLALAAAAIEKNFINSAGLRRFFDVWTTMRSSVESMTASK